MTVARDLAILGFRGDADPTEDELKERFRLQALELHPDRNPSPTAAADFDGLRQVYNRLLERARSPRPCEACDGLGKQLTSHGFFSTSIICPACKGQRKVPRL